MESAVKWRYRVKFAEKAYWFLLVLIGLASYKNPTMAHWILYEQPVITISLVAISILAFSFSGNILEGRSRKSELQVKNLKDKLKDAKRMLVSQMDPLLVEAVKEIVKADMKSEIEQMRDSD